MNHIFKYFNKRKENSKGQRNMTLSFDIKSAKCLRAVVTIMAVVSLFVGSCLSTTVEATKHNKWPKGPSKDSITAASAIVMELNTGAILYNKNMDEKHYPASITKIMTTLLCLENSSLDEVVTFSENAVFSIEPGSSHISIVPGEQMKMEDEAAVTGATVTLELGIDLGKLDRIVQTGAPFTVTSFLQRLRKKR